MFGKLLNAVLDAIDASKGRPLSPGSVTQYGNWLELTQQGYVEMQQHGSHNTPADSTFCNTCGVGMHSGASAVPISRPVAAEGATTILGKNNPLGW